MKPGKSKSRNNFAKKPEVNPIEGMRNSAENSSRKQIEIKANEQKITIECLRLASDGSGVGYHEGKATFVPGLLSGEVGEVQIEEQKKSWQRGRLLTLVKKSQERIEAPCTVFSTCGGCQLQHLDYPQTLEWKKRWVEDALRRIGKVSLEEVMVYPTLGMDIPWRYRNKARMHHGKQGVLGYYQEKSNQTVQFTDCLLISESMNRSIREAELFLKAISEEAGPAVSTEIHSLTFRENSQGEGMLILDTIPEESSPAKEILQSQLMKWLQAESQSDKKMTIQSIWGINKSGMLEFLYGKRDFKEDILNFEFKISPLAFLQVNPTQTHQLYSTVLEWADLSPDKIVWDLYSGIGTITLALAEKSRKVWGIEENPYAVEDAHRNAEHNNVSNVEFIAGKVEDTFLEIPERPDIVVLDPPRAGAHRKVLERLIKLLPDQIVYVSCDPGTLARDLGILQNGGFKVAKVQPVDMFPWSHHVETVVLIERK